jgi:outer membrane protein
MTKLIITWLVLFLFSSSLGLAQETLSLSFDDLPKLIEQNNQNVQGAKSSVEAARFRTHYFHRSFLPQIRAGGGGENFRMGTFGSRTEPVGRVEGNINLLQGGRDWLEEKGRQREKSLSKSGLKQTYFSELTRARQLYINILFLKGLIKDYETSVGLTQKNLRSVKRKINAGLTTDADRLDFVIHKGELAQDLAILKQDYRNALSQLRVLLNIAPQSEMTLEDSLDHDHEDVLFSAQFEPETHYDVTSLEDEQSLLNVQKKQAYLWWSPSLDIFANYSLYPFREREFSSLGDRDEYVVGGRLTFNLFDGLQSFSQGKSLSRRAASKKYQSMQRQRELEAEFQNLQDQLKLHHDLVHGMEKNVSNGQRYLSLTLKEYTRGVKNSPDLLSATKRQLDLKRRFAETLRDFLFVKSELLALLGE